MNRDTLLMNLDTGKSDRQSSPRVRTRKLRFGYPFDPAPREPLVRWSIKEFDFALDVPDVAKCAYEPDSRHNLHSNQDQGKYKEYLRPDREPCKQTKSQYEKDQRKEGRAYVGHVDNGQYPSKKRISWKPFHAESERGVSN